MPTEINGGPDCTHPPTSRMTLVDSPFQVCEGCQAVFDGDTLILEPLDYSAIPTTFDEYEHEHIVTEAKQDDNGNWNLSHEDGAGFGLSREQTGDREFKPGDEMRVITFQGSRIKGVYWRAAGESEWDTLWHYTDAEMSAKIAEERIGFQHKKAREFAVDREKLDLAYEHLPEPFQRRIDKYRLNNPEFRASYEKYEMMCCEQGVLFAETALKKVGYEWEDEHPNTDTVDEVTRQKALDWYEWWANLNSKEQGYDSAQQSLEMPGLDHGHSGNTFGMSVRLGGLWLSGLTEGVIGHYGAMAPLVGSDEYGDVSREEAAASAAKEQ